MKPKGELYAAYHDEEWGVPLHDDQRLFDGFRFAQRLLKSARQLIEPAARRAADDQLQRLVRILLRHRVVIDSVVDNVLHLVLLLPTELVLQVEDVLLRPKLTSADVGKILRLLSGKTVSSLSTLDALHTRLSALHTLSSTLEPHLRTLEARLSALHTRLKTSNTLARALKPKLTCINCLTDSLKTGLRTLHAQTVQITGLA